MTNREIADEATHKDDLPPSLTNIAVLGDCRVPQNFILSKRMAVRLSMPHLCTEQDPCPSRHLTEEDLS